MAFYCASIPSITLRRARRGRSLPTSPRRAGLVFAREPGRAVIPIISRPGTETNSLPSRSPAILGRPALTVTPACDKEGFGRRTTRNPMLLFLLSGLFLLRIADRQFLALLFQLPPRITRLPVRPYPLGGFAVAYGSTLQSVFRFPRFVLMQTSIAVD